MPLTAGTRLGPYEILAPLGAGGMGDVFRARDTKLDRDVAIKVLPEAFAHDAERLARVAREENPLWHGGRCLIVGVLSPSDRANVSYRRSRPLRTASASPASFLGQESRRHCRAKTRSRLS